MPQYPLRACGPLKRDKGRMYELYDNSIWSGREPNRLTQYNGQRNRVAGQPDQGVQIMRPLTLRSGKYLQTMERSQYVVMDMDKPKY